MKIFIFDIDGTLIDSLSKHEEAFYLACNEYNYNIDDDTKEKLKRKSTQYKLDYLSKNKLIHNIDIPWILEKKNELALDLCFADYKPYFQHIDAINYITNELNCKVVLCSNSPREFVNKFIDKCGFENNISFSLSGDDVERKKPYGDIYLKAFRLLNILPNEAIIFEDNEEGEGAAIQAGCHNIVRINRPEDIGPNLILKLQEKYNISYNNSKFFVHK